MSDAGNDWRMPGIPRALSSLGIAGTILVAPGCFTQSVPEAADGERRATVEPPTTSALVAGLGSYRVSRRVRTASEDADRAARAIRVLLGTSATSDAEITASISTEASRSPDLSGDEGEVPWQFSPVRGRPDVNLTYYREHDDLRIVRSDLDVYQRAATDIDEPQARRIFEKYAQLLADEGLVDLEHYDLATPRVSYRKQGLAASNEELTLYVTEYRFTVTRQVAGLECPNDSLRIAVHRSGEVTGIRLLRAEIESAPILAGARKVSEVEISQRFRSEFPGAEVVWERNMYVLPDDVRDAVVGPARVVSFSDVVPGLKGGPPVVSRRREARYSLLEPGRAPEIWPKPDPTSVGDQGK